MPAVELEDCRVPEDPAFPTPAGGYMVSFVALYEQGFSMAPHRFLYLLLRYYGLKLHHLTPSGVLHIVAFVTLCEAYLGIDPEIDLWMYFFRIQHPQDLEVELTIFGGMVIHVKAGHRVDHYLEIPMPRSMKEWQKKWFYLKNNTSTLLPVFIGGRPVPLSSWGGGVARKDLGKLQTLHENIQQLWSDKLTRVHLLRTLFSHRIQPLWRQRTTMWTYPGPSCPTAPPLRN
jgi:hypothetical protein